MKIKIDKENLVYGLTVVSKAVATKSSSLEILGGVEIVAENNEVLMRTTDLEIEISCAVSATIEESGKIILPAKKFLDLAKKLPQGEILLFTEGAKQQIVIKYGSNNVELNCYDPESFPMEQEWSKDTGFTVKAEDFQKAIKQVQSVSAREESRPILTGVLLQSNKNGFSLVATDTYRIAWKKLSVPNMPQIQAVLPGRAMSEVGKLPCAGDEEMTISVNKESSKMSFEVNGIKMVARLLEGQFPDCARVIPKEVSTSLDVSREDFLDVAERCSLIAGDNDNLVSIGVNGALTVSAESPTGVCKETLAVEKNGQDVDISFNSHFLIDGLKLNVGEKISVGFTGPTTPATIRSLEDPDYLYLFMPVAKRPRV